MNIKLNIKKFVAIILLVFPGVMLASSEVAQEHDPLALILLWTTVIFSLALLGRFCARVLNQPGVLGELIMGIIFGNLCYFFNQELIVVLREGAVIFDVMREMLNGATLGYAVNHSIANLHYVLQVVSALNGDNGIHYIKIAYALDTFSRLGIIFLLFMVGLETSLSELKHTGRESVIVAMLGVVAPILMGFLAAYYLLPGSSFTTDLFVAATLSATSIGITARVLSEMKKLHTRESKTILGAAMIDDVLGLIILAVVSSMVVSGLPDWAMITRVVLSTVAFFLVSVSLGPVILRKVIHYTTFADRDEAKLFVSFIFLMTLSWLATVVQLSSIIGAFAAGMIIDDEFFSKKEPASDGKGKSIRELLHPFEALFAPLFFMLIGIQVKLETFFNLQVLWIAGGLTIAAILGKLISGIGASKKVDRLLIGIGMLPRGEVGLVFASIGRTLGIISDELFSAVILMVIITTLLTPILLKKRFNRVSKV